MILPAHRAKIVFSIGLASRSEAVLERLMLLGGTVIGGPFLSHKGLSIPGVKIVADAVSETDLDFVAFALQEGVDTCPDRKEERCSCTDF